MRGVELWHSRVSIVFVDEHVAAGKTNLPSRGNIVDVGAESDEKVKKELCPAVEHFKLHRAAPLECGSAADDEGEVVRSQFGVSIGGMVVCVSGRSENGRTLNAGF